MVRWWKLRNKEQPGVEPVSRNRGGRRWRGAIGAAVWSYPGFLLAVWLVLRLDADRSWFGTALMFAPRWPWLAPVLPLLVVAVLWRRRLVPVVLLSGVVGLWPIARLNVPVGLTVRSGAAGLGTLRVLTCNVHDQDLDWQALVRLIRDKQPDVLFFQEWRWRENAARFPSPEWHTSWIYGQMLVSRFPIRSAVEHCSVMDRGGWVTYELETPWGVVRAYNVHFASPHGALRAVLGGEAGSLDLLETNISDRGAQSMALRREVGPLEGTEIVAGDLNMPVDSGIYRRDWEDAGNAFSQAGWGFGITYEYRHSWLRIDHILFGNGWRGRWGRRTIR